MAPQVTISPSRLASTRPAKKKAPFVVANPFNPGGKPRRLHGPVASPAIRAGRPNRETDAQSSAFDFSAHCLQFVASPGRASKLQSILPTAIREAFSEVPAFAGCMVMVSDQEARRVTIVTFWKGPAGSQHGGEDTERLKATLFPYVDHWLRAENHLAHFVVGNGPGESQPAQLLFQNVTLP